MFVVVWCVACLCVRVGCVLGCVAVVFDCSCALLYVGNLFAFFVLLHLFICNAICVVCFLLCVLCFMRVHNVSFVVACCCCCCCVRL